MTIDLFGILCYNCYVMYLIDYLPILDKLTEEERLAIEKSATYKKLKKGTVINRTKGECSGLFIILSGEIRVYTISNGGREITLYRLFDRDICLFSASCILKNIQFDLAIETKTDTEAVVIPADVYKKIMDASAPLANFTNEIISSRFTDVMWLLDQIMWKSFDSRLADFLLEQRQIAGNETIKITHEEIGNNLGNPREVVTRMLKYFQNEGIVKLSRGTIKILDTKRLFEIAEK